MKRDWKGKKTYSTDCTSSNEDRDKDDLNGLVLRQWGLGENAVQPERETSGEVCSR